MPLQRFGLLGLVIALVVGACVLRFNALDRTPPGYYVDEAAISAQVLCVRDAGHDLSGREWPLFSRVLAGGFATPPMLYAGALWTKIFGPSISSFRALSAAFGVLFVVATFFLSMKLWESSEAAWLSALCAAISPWAFQFSRISWDPALAPGLLALALVLFFADDSRSKALLGGLVAALAAYSYPPIRLQLTLVLPAALFFRYRVLGITSWRPPLYYFAAALAAVGPLVLLTVRGDLQRRYRLLSVFNEGYLRQFGEPTLFAGLREFAKNLLSNFSPTYLFWSGDSNPRHSTQALGQWGPVESFAFLALLCFATLAITQKKKIGRAGSILLFCAYGYVAGVVPAALTWESNPHALRSIGAVVFLASAAGGVLAFAWQRARALRIAIVSLALASSAYYFLDFFNEYPARAEHYFDVPAVIELMRLKEKQPLTEEAARESDTLRNYPILSLRYFQQAQGSEVCR